MRQIRGKRVYTTQYTQGNTVFAAWLWAKNDEEAALMAGRRGLNEEVWGRYGWFESDTWVNLRLRRRPGSAEKRLHYLTFLAFVALKSSWFTADTVMGDLGWFHAYIHKQTIKSNDLPSMEEINMQIYHVEAWLGFTP